VLGPRRHRRPRPGERGLAGPGRRSGTAQGWLYVSLENGDLVVLAAGGCDGVSGRPRGCWHLTTHSLALDDAVKGYELFKDKQDGCARAVFHP
jgi:hypothetical protein